MLFQRLITHGCSFTYGLELNNSLTESWPGILAKRLNVEFKNLAKIGYANDGIVEDIIDEELNPVTDLVIIMWTWKHRIFLVDDKGWFSCFPENSDPGLRNTTSSLLMATLNQQWLHKRWLNQIILLQNYFKNNKINYLFVNAFNNNYDNPNILYLENKINKQQFVGWPNINFNDFNDALGFEKLPLGHLNKEAHFAFSEVIFERIVDLYRGKL